MSTIPLFLLEEHHEAFLAWNYSVMKGWIPAENNTLLHVDEHSDLQFPALDTPVRSALGSLKEMVSFTYSQLGVASFLYPALYLGLFNRIFWLRQKHDGATEPEVSCVTSEDGDGRRLRISSPLNLSEALHEDRRCFQFSRITAEESVALPGDCLILDIDLDCFSCDNLRGEDWEIEITKAAYQAMQDSFHPLRLASGNLVKAKQRDGSYYLCSNYGALAIGNLKVDEKDIRERIDAFVQFLRRNAVKPALIDIARSRLSGYTPSDQWQFIEKTLLDGLSSLYDYDVITPAGLTAAD